MKGIANKTKIIIVVAVFIIFATVMFLFGYGIMAGRNQATADLIASKKTELESLKREQKSFEEGKKDLAQLKDSVYPPEELFSSDTKVVKEIQQLEATALRYDLELRISVSGNTKTALKVPGTIGELYAIPYTISLDGEFRNILKFMQTAERLPFITHAKSVSVNVTSKDETNTSITSEFYIKK